jgi:hypothetical protein
MVATSPPPAIKQEADEEGAGQLWLYLQRLKSAYAQETGHSLHLSLELASKIDLAGLQDLTLRISGPMELRIYEGRASLPECLVEMLYIAHTSLRSLTIHYTGEAPTQPWPLRNIIASRLLKTTFDRFYNPKLKRRLQKIKISFDYRLEKLRKSRSRARALASTR